MAAAFCCPIVVAGTMKVEADCLQSRNNRNYPVWSGAIGRSWFCSCPKTFHKTSVTRLGLKQQKQNRSTFFKSSSDIIHEEETAEVISQTTLIWRAVKLPIYSVALAPLIVGSAAAFWQSGLFSGQRFFVLLASSVLVIAWLNLSNDVYDFDTGADKNKKESVVKLVGCRTGTLVAAYISLILGLMGLSWTSIQSGNLRSLLLLASAITCGYIYQCPPFRLSYLGLGEPLCFSAFGPFATTAFYLLQSRELPVTGTLLSASLLVGFTTTLILFCSHFHQVKGDTAVGKISPLVRLGTGVGSNVIRMAMLVFYSFLSVAGLCGYLPLTCIILCAITIPIARFVVSFVEANHKDNAKIFMSKYYCVRLHAAFAVALAAGLVAARMFPGVSMSGPIIP